ncbi:MAG: endonuclease/exonuclease/phosphatase family protein [Pirellula sp.]
MNPLLAQTPLPLSPPPPSPNTIRVATFNLALNRKANGQLVRDLKNGDEQAQRLAWIVQLVRPDVLLANEVDYSNGEAAKLLSEDYFNKSHAAKIATTPCEFKHYFTGPVNTGVPSGMDLNSNGNKSDNEDCWGFGAFPGQYGMVVYSRFPIVEKDVRTFQMFKWSTMPGAKRPKIVDKNTGEEKYFYPDNVWSQLRLSSKSHWDVPVLIGNKTLHFIASHPTPPVFDGPEDRNGCRNHDEIRLLRDYVEGSAEYFVDDHGVAGPLDHSAQFVIAGDLNSDPEDGSGISQGIIDLLKSNRVSASFAPASLGAVEASKLQGKLNDKHRGNPAHDTGDFNDASVGNLRIDFVLPSANCKVVGGGVFWPTSEQLKNIDPKLSDASDHHMVWLDIQL